MKKLFSGRILTIPNLLSAIRILLIPLFLWLYLKRDDVPATAVVLALSGLTDALDGLIARRCHMISDLGKALDPTADKLTQLAMLCCLLVRFPRMLWLIIVLCVKELFVAATGLLVIRRTDVVLSADWHGKVTTILLYAVMILHLVWLDLPWKLSWGLELLCMGMLLFSGVLYGIRNFRAARREKSSGDEAGTDSDTDNLNETGKESGI